MTWEEYLIKKKINSASFKKNEPERWEEWRILFEQIHPSSFTDQKKFLINETRRKYLLKVEEKPVEEKKEEVKKTDTPVKKTGPTIKIPPRKTS